GAYGAETAAFARATFDSPSVQDVASAVDSFPGAHIGFVASAPAASAAALLGGDVNEERLADAAELLDKARVSAELVSEDSGSRRPFVSILLFSAQVAAARGLPADALAAIDTALAMAPSRTVEAVLTGAKAEVFAGAGDMGGAAELHGVAVAVAAAAGHPGLAAEQAINAGNAFAEADEHHEAATRYAYALSLNPPGATSPLGLRWAYALSSVNSGGAEVAIPILEDMRNEEVGDAPAAALAETRYHLARAYDATYDDRAAAEYLAAAHGAMGADSHALAAVAAYAAGRELHYQGRVTEAIEAFELARGALAVAPNPGLEVDLLLSYAGSLGAAGNGSWQAAADEAVALAEAHEDEHLNAKAHFIRLSLLADLAVRDRVIALAEGVSARMLGLGEPGRAAAAIHWKATALLATDHFEDAIAALTTVARDEAFDVHERVACAQRLAETFAEAGRKPEAAQWKAYGKKLGKPLTYKKLKDLYRFISRFEVEERIRLLGLHPDRADVIVPATEIFLQVMKWAGISKMFVPFIGLSDGLIHLLYE
ncbi:MAG: hypothetical protein HGA45_44530, partial [Chloroflexales bacterium]|nr:hypothetical protein [Chloroflexales bacterium]